MRITKIFVKGLFGMFDHEIPLNQESRITIIYGPNGVGKTVLMKLVHSLFQYEYDYIGEIPFLQFSLSIDTGKTITVHRVSDGDTLLVTMVDENGYFNDPFEIRLSSRFDVFKEAQLLLPDSKYFDEGATPYLLAETASSKYVTSKETRPRTHAQILDEFPQIHAKVYGEMPEWFRYFRECNYIEMIHAQRLSSHPFGVYRLSEKLDRVRQGEDYRFNLDNSVIYEVRRHALLWDTEDVTILFEDIINSQFLFKKLNIDDGTLLGFITESGDEVDLGELSSGEQQLIILFIMLLFEYPSDSLVMIDEPELSMNIVWQRNFLKDLQRIVALCKFDVLISTHSPEIIFDKWDWAVALGAKVDD